MFHLDRVDHVCGVSEAGQVRGRGGGEPLHSLELDIVRNNIMEGKQNSAGIFAPTPCNLHFSWSLKYNFHFLIKSSVCDVIKRLLHIHIVRLGIGNLKPGWFDIWSLLQHYIRSCNLDSHAHIALILLSSIRVVNGTSRNFTVYRESLKTLC